MTNKFTQGVIKIASRCNLNCTYCYVYNKGDTTFKSKPKFMSNDIMKATVDKIYNHCEQKNVDMFNFIFHGGEPMLAGRDRIGYFVEYAKQKFESSETNILFSMQTNGLLIDNDWCDFFEKYEIGPGISLDGDKVTNDEYRIDHKGKGSYDSVINGLNNLKNHEWTHNKWGLISVINVNKDPIQTYNHFKELGCRSLNFLFPDKTWNEVNAKPSDLVLANWLIKIFDQWFNEKVSEKPDILIFSSLISIILGGESAVEHFGKNKNEIVVIETDGFIEAEDSLRGCGNGFTRTDSNILNEELDEAFNGNLAKLYHNSAYMLCKECSSCPLNEICSGGFLLHRYSDVNGFNNPSVYCEDLMLLITHIQKVVLSELPKEVLEEAGVSYINYDQVKKIRNKSLKNNQELEYEYFLESFKKLELHQ